MAQVQANGINIEVETLGDDKDPPVVLIMGLGGQLTFWPAGFVEQLVNRGYHVILLDNRDVGLSTWFDDAPNPSPAFIALSSFLGFQPKTPYTLSDMASDTAGVLDALEISSAHIIGASMGGMIAQRLAIEHPTRVRSLCSIMSSPRPPRVPIRLMWNLLKLNRVPNTREERIERRVEVFRLLNGTGLPFNEKTAYQVMTTAVDRAWYPGGTARQMSAIMADRDRRPALSALTVPNAVIHGT
ncbi:uncharacterized protein METZ01_LOCUS248649, partial [marine metagenome]